MEHKETAFSESQNQDQNLFTAKDAEDAKGTKTLPLIHGKPGQVNTDEQEQVKERAEALALNLAQTYEELTRLLEQNPGVKREITEGEAKEDKVYQKLKQRLKLADIAPRCRWVRQGGTTCGSPQMKQHIYCFAHMQMAEAQALALRLPPPEDANAIQIGLMRIQKAVIEGTISTKMAGLLLYSMQLALTNVGQTTFGKAKDEEMVRETVDEEIALSNQQSAFNQNQEAFTAKDAKGAKGNGERQNQQQNQNRFTAEGAENAEESKTLPRMDADECGLEEQRKPVEWRPSADMYRMDTREGREAYEASLRMKTRTSVDGEATAPRAAVPHEHAEPHAVLG